MMGIVYFEYSVPVKSVRVKYEKTLPDRNRQINARIRGSGKMLCSKMIRTRCFHLGQLVITPGIVLMFLHRYYVLLCHRAVD